MPSSAPAVWSAVAATFAALSSFLIMLIQRRNLLEAARPELVLTGWSREAKGNDEDAYEVISFRTIRNVGRGVALNVILNSFPEKLDRFPAVMLSTLRVPILAANESEEINGGIAVWWKDVDANGAGPKCLLIRVEILCWDSRGMRHQTLYSLFAVNEPTRLCMSDAIAPGVSLSSRRTVTRPVWWLNLRERVERLRRRTRAAERAHPPEPAARPVSNGESSPPAR